jgi:beta-lactamase class A
VVIGEDLGFTPASLFKLPVVLAVLKLSERDQSLLDRRLLFMMPDDEFTQQIAPDRTLVPGQEYTVRQLVEQTLTESDNSAVNLLHGLLPGDLVFETFRDLELPVPTRDHIENFYKVREYAAFLRTLYNASYLSPEKSEWAMELLADARFRDGIVAGVPDTIRVAHKFGERHLYDGPPGTHQQLHDCGIVYFPGHPYLLCVMTRGESLPVLGGVIRDISAAVYDDYARRDPAGVAVR